MKISSKRLGEILIEKGMITEAQLNEVLQEQKQRGGFLGAIIVEKGWISKKGLSGALAEQFGIPMVELDAQNINMDLVGRFSSSLILDYQCFPLSEDEDSITVAIINPLNVAAVSKIEEIARPRKVKFVVVTEENIKEVIQNYRQCVSDGIRRLLKKEDKA